MNAINDGGPAFPSGKSERQGFENSLPYYEGMSLRDYFAGMALQGNLASQSNGYSYGGRWNQAAIESYQIADAMLAASEGKEEK